MQAPSVFKRRNNAGLPTSNAPPSNSSSGQFSYSPWQNSQGYSYNDGSAKGIRLPNPLVTHWQKANRATRITYSLLVFFLFLFYFGYRSVRYYNASVWVTCHARDCVLQITPTGWGRKTKVTLAKSQLIGANAVKSTQDGFFVEGTPELKQEMLSERKGKKKKGVSNYKGPDEDGHYITYALILRERGFGGDNATEEPTEWTGERLTHPDEEEPAEMPEQDLSPIKPYVEDMGNGQYRLVMRKFRIAQSRRRVRTMVQKVDSYIKRRRQKLVLKENAVPSVVGVVAMVISAVGFILTILIGQFWEDSAKPKNAGPGARRGSPKTQTSRTLRPMPSSFEVSTKPKAKFTTNTPSSKKY